MPDFVCRRCGKCCRVPGYVRLRDGEAEAIAAYLAMPRDRFMADYARLTADRRCLSLTEGEGTACIFLAPDNRCRIEPVKPAQCREFPRGWRFNGWQDICAGARDAGPFNDGSVRA